MRQGRTGSERDVIDIVDSGQPARVKLAEDHPLGQAFDPHQHEAISHQPDAKVPAESVLTVVRTGFSLNGRLLRPAAVVVSSGPAS